jgi:hypothetical protein
LKRHSSFHCALESHQTTKTIRYSVEFDCWMNYNRIIVIPFIRYSIDSVLYSINWKRNNVEKKMFWFFDKVHKKKSVCIFATKNNTNFTFDFSFWKLVQWTGKSMIYACTDGVHWLYFIKVQLKYETLDFSQCVPVSKRIF